MACIAGGAAVNAGFGGGGKFVGGAEGMEASGGAGVGSA